MKQEFFRRIMRRVFWPNRISNDYTSDDCTGGNGCDSQKEEVEMVGARHAIRYINTRKNSPNLGSRGKAKERETQVNMASDNREGAGECWVYLGHGQESCPGQRSLAWSYWSLMCHSAWSEWTYQSSFHFTIKLDTILTTVLSCHGFVGTCLAKTAIYLQKLDNLNWQPLVYRTQRPV